MKVGLPKEIKIKIISYLNIDEIKDKLIFLSKEFYNLSMSRLKFANFQGENNYELIERILEKWKFIENINLSCSNINILILKNRNYKNIILNETEINDKEFNIFSDYKNLNSLSCGGCYQLKSPILKSSTLLILNLSYTLINDNTIENILKNCQNVNELDISSCNNIINPKIFHDKLKKLDISYTKINNLSDIIKNSQNLM
jgi:hypothetical protein